MSSAGGRLTNGDVAILQFVAAAERLEADVCEQHNELGGLQDGERPGASGEPSLQLARPPVRAALEEPLDG